MSVDAVHIPLSDRALIAVGGPDWRGFLDNLLTQSVGDLRPGEARFGALLTPQGRLLHDLFVVGRPEADGDGCWLDVAADQRAAVIQRLMIYRLRAKVEIAADDNLVIAIFHEPLPPAGRGRGGGAAPAELTPPPPTPSPQGGGVVVRDPRLAELGWRAYGVQVDGDPAAYDAHRLALGVPGPADWGSDKTYPIEANFDLLHGIDFQKGCFVGQETTSRMKRRGQVKSRMLPIVFVGAAPAAGSEVLAGALRAGEVLSGMDGRAMALVRLDRVAGAELTVDGRPVQVERPAWFAAATTPPG
jgi:folate-binding protein YgfZ